MTNLQSFFEKRGYKVTTEHKEDNLRKWINMYVVGKWKLVTFLFTPEGKLMHQREWSELRNKKVSRKVA